MVLSSAKLLFDSIEDLGEESMDKRKEENANSLNAWLRTNLAGEVAAAAQVAKAKRSATVVSPISGSRSSARGKGLESEPIL
jgi:hypothetical protein